MPGREVPRRNLWCRRIPDRQTIPAFSARHVEKARSQAPDVGLTMRRHLARNSSQTIFEHSCEHCTSTPAHKRTWCHGQLVSVEGQISISRISQPCVCDNAKTTAVATFSGLFSFASAAGLD